MMSTENNQPDDVDLTLPWYATGRLSAVDRARIEAALDKDEEKRRQLAVVREEVAATVTLNEDLPAAPPQVLDRLMTRIAHREAQNSASSLSQHLLSKIAAWLRSLSSPALAWSAIAAAVVICAEAGVLGSLLMSRPQGSVYKTAALNEAAELQGTYALVSFVGTTSLMEVTDFLRQQHMVLQDGPKPGGFYRVKIADRKLTGAELTARLAALRAQRNVVGFIVPEPSRN